MYYLFHVEVGHSATHTHLLRNRVHQFHASFFTSHVIIYKLLNRRVTDPSGATFHPVSLILAKSGILSALIRRVALVVKSPPSAWCLHTSGRSDSLRLPNTRMRDRQLLSGTVARFGHGIFLLPYVHPW